MKHLFVMAAVAGLFMVGCATTPQARFYLVPDPDGNVGEMEVTNEADTIVLNKANEAVDAPSADAAFSPVRQAAAGEIHDKFGDALNAMPPAPRGFNIYFDSGSARINAESQGGVSEIMAEVKARDSRDISLNGHTDRVGDSKANMALSLKRADTVKKLLLSAGVVPEYIQVEYYGESKPVVPTDDNVDEPLNRRVEVVVR